MSGLFDAMYWLFTGNDPDHRRNNREMDKYRNDHSGYLAAPPKSDPYAGEKDSYGKNL